MTRLEWLKRLTLPAPLAKPDGVTSHVWLLPPQQGRLWTVATNGKAIVFLDGVLEGVPVAGEIAAKLLRFLEPAAPMLEPVSLRVLKLWCGPPVWEQTCDKCRGASVNAFEEGIPSEEHAERYCDECECTGKVSVGPRYGRLCGVPLNRELLAEYLEGVEGGEAPMVHGTEEGPLWVVEENWRVVICRMTLRSEVPAAWAEMPVLGGRL